MKKPKDTRLRTGEKALIVVNCVIYCVMLDFHMLNIIGTIKCSLHNSVVEMDLVNVFSRLPPWLTSFTWWHIYCRVLRVHFGSLVFRPEKSWWATSWVCAEAAEYFSKWNSLYFFPNKGSRSLFQYTDWWRGDSGSLLLWRRGGSSETFLLSTATWKEVVVRWGSTSPLVWPVIGLGGTASSCAGADQVRY